jgi:hypothetical protein
MDSAEMKRVQETLLREAAAPPSTTTPRPPITRREEDDPAPDRALQSDRPSAPRVESWPVEAPTGTRRKERSHRPPVTVDDVGPAAVKIANTTRRESAPKVIASRATIAKAPIDTRTAFVLSLVDARNTVEAIIDMSGMRADEVNTILARLARLGLITLP